jgi:gliding motility-associated-like protein
MKRLLIAMLMLPIIAVGQCDTVYIEVEVPIIYGCTWPASCNYNDEATVDDGSCLDCTTPYEVGALLCDNYHGIDGIWDWWISIKCGIYEPPVQTCDTVYVDLPQDTLYVKLPQDTVYIDQTDTLYVSLPVDTLYVELPPDTIKLIKYVKLPADTIYSTSVIDCFTGEPCADCSHEIYIPNAFSPNGDGVNDLFCPSADYECWNALEFMIYNRWGQLIYIGDLLNGDCWDGAGAAQGVYIWAITGESGQSFVNSGHVTLFR